MSRFFALAATLAATLAVGATAGAHSTANAARTCAPGKYPGQGYFQRLVVSHVSCATGKRVMRAHYRCRVKHGRKGFCPRVLGYRCKEVRNGISTEYNARVTCTRGSRKVVYYYQQFLD
jgi:hypothetical protein